MRTGPLEPPVELSMGPRSVVLGGGSACEFRHWDIRWSSLFGHETLYSVGEPHADCAIGTFGGAPSGTTQRWAGEPHAGCATGTFGAALYWATKRCTGWGKRMRAAPLGPS
eukprot:1899671-Pyramimonas_sp.AAC.1